MKFKFIKMLEADTGAGVNGADNTSNADTTTTDTQETSNTENQTTEKTFTQEDVNKMIQDRITREQAKWEKKVQDERTEAEKLAKMKADEKLKYQQEKRDKELAQREKDITTRELKITSSETLAEKNLPKELVNILNYDSAESCNNSIDVIEKAWTEANGTWQEAIEKEVNKRLRGGNPPKGGSSTSGTTFGFNFQGVRPKK